MESYEKSKEIEEGEITVGCSSAFDSHDDGDRYALVPHGADDEGSRAAKRPCLDGTGEGKEAESSARWSPSSRSSDNTLSDAGDGNAADGRVRVFMCPVCREEFGSLKAVHGHLWIHDLRGRPQQEQEKKRPVAVDGSSAKTGKRGRCGRESTPEREPEDQSLAIVVAKPNLSQEETAQERAAEPQAGGVEEAPRFACAICGKTFRTHQGLGGHVAGHRNKERGVAAAGENGGSAAQANAKAPKEHKCKWCGQEYATGVALGGHMRRHYTGPPIGQKGKASLGHSPAPAVEAPKPICLRLFGFDIIMPTKEETQEGSSSK